MQDPQNKRKEIGDKIDSDGEIRIPTARERRAEREHGKLYKWFDNFWYHNKWKTLVCLFLALVILVCTLQMCKKEDEGDIMILLAGPYNLAAEEEKYMALRKCLSNYLPSDYDGNGIKQVDMDYHAVYSKEQIEEIDGSIDPETGAEIKVNTSANTQSINNYNQRMMLGHSAVLFLDPWLFEEMVTKKDSEYLVALDSMFGVTGERAGAVCAEKNGAQTVYGIRLGDTELYQNAAVSNILPADTVICLMQPLALSKNHDPEVYQKAKDYFVALAGI